MATREYRILFTGINVMTRQRVNDSWYTEAESGQDALAAFWDRVEWGVITRHTEINQSSIELYGITCPAAHANTASYR